MGMPSNGMVKKSTIEDIIREDLADIWSILNSEEKHLIAENCFVSEITIAELFYGAAKSGRQEHFDDVKNLLLAFDLMPIFSSLQLYGVHKAGLEAKGQMIGEFDLLIGSCAVYNDLVMVTSNVKHFDHIPNIKIEDWAQKSNYKR